MNVDLKTGIVRVLKPNGETAGAGFVVTDDGLIATCAHVVEAARVGPGEVVRIILHATGEERQAHVEPDWWRAPDAEDVAILRPEGPLSEEVTALTLGSSGGTSGHPFKTLGFPDLSPEGGVLGDSHILGETTLRGVRVLQLSSPQITPGFSGAPVLDTVTRRVVGMMTSIAVPPIADHRVHGR